MILAGSDAQGVVFQLAALCRHGNGAFGGSSQTGDPFGHLVDLVQDDVGKLVEQLVQGDEVRTFDVPMRLLDLALQINGVSQPVIQNDGNVAADFLRQVDLRLVHWDAPSKQQKYFRLFCTALAANPKKESDVGRGGYGALFREDAL